jgi:hypothetical protein
VSDAAGNPEITAIHLLGQYPKIDEFRAVCASTSLGVKWAPLASSSAQKRPEIIQDARPPRDMKRLRCKRLDEDECASFATRSKPNPNHPQTVCVGLFNIRLRFLSDNG